MQAEFWENCWKNDNIGFHEHEPNPIFVRNLSRLKLKLGDRVLIPLCGKTLDISWLLSQGYKVAGIELSEIAIQQLFDEMGLQPEITVLENIKRYRAENVDILVGDFFDVTQEAIGHIDAIFDRGSLVALPEDMRSQYAKHLQGITDNVPQLLVCFEYDQALMEGPPFSITPEELNRYYESNYNLQLIESSDTSSRLGVGFQCVEKVWLVGPR